MINKLKYNSKIKIISLLSAMVLWMYVMAIVDPEETKLFENIPVTITNKNELNERDLVIYPEQDLTTNIYVTGKLSNLKKVTKDDIRQLSKDMELNTHNKPAFACLATRIPYGTKITKELLKKIEKSEEYLISVRFKQFRVRAHNDIARIEVGKDEIHKFFNEDLLNKTNKKLKEIGFKYVTLDMAGYEMGSMNK